MTVLKTVQTSYFPVSPSPGGGAPPPRRRRSTLRLSRANGPDPESSDGDKRKQEILARIAMLQTQKVRLTDFLDERSAYLTQFAEDANAEFEQIGEDALKELDEASARIMGKLDERMQAFEETAEESKREIERNEKILEEFEEKVERGRNEGLFFQSLGSRKPKNPSEAKMAGKAEASKLRELEKEKAGSKGRRGVYLALMAVLGVAIADAAFAGPATDLRKVAAFAFLFLSLLAQYVYELRLSDEEPSKPEE